MANLRTSLVASDRTFKTLGRCRIPVNNHNLMSTTKVFALGPWYWCREAPHLSRLVWGLLCFPRAFPLHTPLLSCLAATSASIRAFWCHHKVSPQTICSDCSNVPVFFLAVPIRASCFWECPDCSDSFSFAPICSGCSDLLPEHIRTNQ